MDSEDRSTQKDTSSSAVTSSLSQVPLIINGDQAAFEIEHATTPLQERPDWPLPSFDARDWAAAFCKVANELGLKDDDGNPVDEGWMIGWFSNALMRGFDEHYARNPLGKIITDLLKSKRIMVICSHCSTHSPEQCGHFTSDDLRVAPSGEWLCFDCYDGAGVEPEWKYADKVPS